MSLLFDEISQQPQVLASAREKNQAVISAIAEEFKSLGLDSVYFAARGTSDHACIYAQYLFAVCAGIPCTLGTPSVISKYGAKMNFAHSAVIGVSQSGKAADVLAVIDQANEAGKLTIAITNDEESPLAKTAKYHLFCGAGLEKSIAATKTFTAQMYLLACLCAEISGNGELSDALDKVSGDVASLLSYMPDTLTGFAEKYKAETNMFILGRGLVYPIALEGALKILETNRICVKGNAISDFYHGPLAQVHENTLVMVLAAKGAAFDDATAMIKRLDEIGADVLVFTNDEELKNSRENCIYVQDTGCEMTMPYVMAATMQLFAYKLTEVKGIDPNVSPVLKKITITK